MAKQSAVEAISSAGGVQASFHRPDRTAPVKVIALQGDYHSKDSDVFPMLEQYCEVCILHRSC